METAKAIFDPIDHDSVADAVVHQIEAMIVNGILKEEMRLPSEREMAELLEVSRPKLREALKKLEEHGLLIVRHGEGSFVAKLTGTAMTPAFLDLYSRHPEAFYDYLEYRREQESFAARLAATRATETDKEIIRKILARMDAAHEAGDQEASKEADMRLHTAIVDASHNSTLIHMMGSVYELTRRGIFYNRNFLRSIDTAGDELLKQHHDLVDAVCAGDPVAAETAAKAHLDFVERAFRQGSENERRMRMSEKRRILWDRD